MTPEELRARRKALGLSQQLLAEALGVTQHTISRWEEGKMNLSAPRSLWLDVEMKRVERERRPKKRRRTAPTDGDGGGSDGVVGIRRPRASDDAGVLGVQPLRAGA